MAVSFSVRLSDTVKDNRWAAEFFRPGFSFSPKSANEWCKIRKITAMRQYGMSLVMNEEERGYPIYRLNEIENCFMSSAPSKYAAVPKVEAQKFFLEDGDVLFCRTNGNINYVGRTGIWYGNRDCVFASYLVRVRTKQDQLLPEYLTVYLNTTFGRRQIVRRAMPSNQVNVSASELMKIDIFVPELSLQKEISKIVKSAHKKKSFAVAQFAAAEQLLSDALKLDALHFQRPLSYTAKFSEIMAQGRADADYFQIPYVQLRERVLNSAGGYIPLTDLCDFLRPNINPAKAPKDKFSYVELADINSGLGLIDACESYCGAALPSRARRQVRAGDVLASAVVGSIDKSAVVGGKQDGFVASTGFFHLRPKPGVPPEFLLMLMRSPVVQMQLQQQATGGILSAVPDSRIKYILVPRIDVAVQKDVAKLVKTAHKKHTESLMLLEEAKARVEQLIEEAAKS